MLRVGFEPTRANTSGLKSDPLDQLGHLSITIYSGVISLSVFYEKTLK